MAYKRSSVCKNGYNSSDMSNDATYVESPFKRQRKSAKLPKTENLQEGGRRRGRRPSQKPCLNHNAQMARRNREKKKQYLEHLESQINKYAEETQHYKEIIHKKTITERRLEAEVAYLKSVMNNKSNIERLLQSLNESLQKNTTNPAHTSSNQNQRFTQGKESILPGELRNRQATLTETHGMGLTNQFSSEFGFDCLSQLILPDGDPFLISSEEGLDSQLSQLPITPESIEDNSSGVLLDQNKLNLIENIEDFANSCQLDEASSLDFGATTDSLLEDNCLKNLDNTVGICLHVNPNRVSLEFCSSCQRNSLHSERIE